VATATKLKTVHLKLPASTEELAKLEIGTVVYLTGRVYTAREGVYKKAVEDGAGLPAAPEELGLANFHCSPAASVNADGSHTVGAVTGTGALLGRGIRRVVATHWVEQLGLAQAIWVLEVENFGPFLVDGDLAGNSLFERENAKIAPGIDKLYAGTKPATLRRYGETDDKTDEVI
jgi:L(+)-tartrate dehydratase beta subunit